MKQSKWDTHISPYISEISKWARKGFTDKEISARLGIGYSTFRRYARDRKELQEPLTESRRIAKETAKKAVRGKVRPIDPTASRRKAQAGRSAANPRSANGNLRRKHRERLKAIGGECGICHGKLGPIHYDEPSDAQHPLSFVVDEIKPVSRWKEFGYASPEAAAQDWNNLQAAHYVCNSMKGNKLAIQTDMQNARRQTYPSDGDW